MTVKRVINEDMTINFFEIGDPITTGDLDIGTFYVIDTLASGTAIPEGYKPRDVFLAKSAITLASGDSVKPITMSKFCGYQNVDVTISVEQVDVTAICDLVSTFRSGRKTIEASGTLIVETSTGEETATDVVFGDLVTFLSEQEDLSVVRSETGKLMNVALNLTENIAGVDVKDIWMFFPAQITSGGFTGGTNSAKTADVSLSVTTGEFDPHFVKMARIAA